MAKFDPAVLPPSFYDETPLLDLIRRKANHVIASPDAVLLTCLARVSAAFRPAVKIAHHESPLSLFVAIVGPPGAGKSKAATAARALLSSVGIDVDGIPVPSGEGMWELFLSAPESGTGKRNVVNQTGFFYVDEGLRLMKVGRREGSTTLDAFREVWTLGGGGTANADKDRRRMIPAGSLQVGLVVGFQPDAALELFRGPEVGDPQRFVFTSAVWPYLDNVIPRDVPALTWEPSNRPRSLTVPREIVDHVERYQLRATKGEVEPDPLETHDLWNQLRVAAALTLFHNADADEVAAADWIRAAQIIAVSAENRRRLVEYAKAKADEKQDEHDRRRIVTNAKVTQARDDDKRAKECANLVAAFVRTNSPATWSDIHNGPGRKYRDVLKAAVALAVERGDIHEVAAERGRLFETS